MEKGCSTWDVAGASATRAQLSASASCSACSDTYMRTCRLRVAASQLCSTPGLLRLTSCVSGGKAQPLAHWNHRPGFLVPSTSSTTRPASQSSVRQVVAASSSTNSMLVVGEIPPNPVDKAQFNQQLIVPALRVPVKRCNDLMRQLRGHTLDKPRLRCIVTDPNDKEHKLLLLSETLDTSALPDTVQQVIAKEGCELTSHAVTLDYGHFNAEQVLKKLLPAGVDAPSSFETVGHVVHLNLRDEQLPYKHMIGQVLVDKNPHVKTVVNKVGNIDNEFRVFKMELLAGDGSTETEVVQHGTRFKLDFSQVYWNSRLEAEHQRLVSQYFTPGQVIVDIMAGIGPFAIPAAQHGCKVYANDLNPCSTRYMAVNVKLNKVSGGVSVFNMDGRAFLRLICDTPGHNQLPVAAPDSAQAQAAPAAPSGQGSGKGTGGLVDVPPVPPGFQVQPGGILFQHAVMNLPASAVEFLDAFNGAFDPAVWAGKLPLVHVYTFKTAAQSEQDVIDRVQQYLGGPLEEPPTIHQVRDVAPNKLMLCVTFRVPAAVAFNGRNAEADRVQEPDPAAKRQKTD